MGHARVRTSEDSALTRSRGCGDVLVFGLLALIGLVLVMMLASCTPEEERLRRLEAEASIARLHLMRVEGVRDSVRASGATPAELAAWSDSVATYRRRVELAERDVRRMLR